MRSLVDAYQWLPTRLQGLIELCAAAFALVIMLALAIGIGVSIINVIFKLTGVTQ